MTTSETGPPRNGLDSFAFHPNQDLGTTLQGLVLESMDLEDFLARLATVAAAVLSGPSNPVSCVITVLAKKKGITTAGSDQRVRTLDALQIEFGDGPCLTAVRHGIGSVLAVPLDLAGEAEAVMNLYSSTPHGFTGADITAAEEFAGSAAQSLRLALMISQLRSAKDDLTAAMQSRSTIDTAVGVVMAQNRCGRDTAFRILTKASNSRNIKLRDIAAQVVSCVCGEIDLGASFDE